MQLSSEILSETLFKPFQGLDNGTSDVNLMYTFIHVIDKELFPYGISEDAIKPLES